MSLSVDMNISTDTVAHSEITTEFGGMELPNATASVVTRYPPELSTYLHIGHTKAALLNDHFAHIQYPSGKLILRFDDANVDQGNDLSDVIKEDLAMLDIKPDKISYTSDYFDVLQKYCIQLIKSGQAYADDTGSDTIKAMRMEGLPSTRREDSLNDSLKRFELMQSSPNGSSWCIRAKISYNDKNPALRDPVIYRSCQNQAPHPHTGSIYRAYPTYMFVCPILDSIEGVTHALRMVGYEELDAVYNWILKSLGLRIPDIWRFSTIQFIRTLTSKRRLSKLIDNGMVSGWDDPRLPTVRGLVRRGLTSKALRDYMISQGPSKIPLIMNWNPLWAINEKVISQKACRFIAMEGEPVVCKVVGSGVPGSATATAYPRHAEHDLGSKQVWYSQTILMQLIDVRDLQIGEDVVLRYWGNASVISRDQELENDNTAGNPVSITFELHSESDMDSTAKQLDWLSKDQNLVPVDLVDYDHLLIKEALSNEEQQDWEQYLTPQTEFRSQALADCNVWQVMVNDVVEFEGKGYYRCDQNPSEQVRGVFFKIPSGH